jgi:hypothetical protein
MCLSPIRRGFAPGFVNYKKGAFDSQPQVIKFTSCLSMVGGSLRVLRLLAVLVIGLYELLGNPTTYFIEAPGPLRDMKYIVVGTMCLSNSLFTVLQCARVVLLTSMHSDGVGIIGRLTVIYIIMQYKRN